jgi:RNA polymerase sigma-70 factor (ECF subfamily)
MSAVQLAQPAASAEAEQLAALLLRMRRGDQQALVELYDRTLSRVFALVARILRNDADAEEVVCDVYRQAWENSVDYSAARGAVLAWLLIIARSRALDLLRRRRARGIEEPLHPDDDLDAYREREGQSLDAPQAAWVDALTTGSAVRRALEALSAAQRRVLELAFFEDLTHQEIAQHTGWPLGTVKSHLRRGLCALRPILGRAGHGSEGIVDD